MKLRDYKIRKGKDFVSLEYRGTMWGRTSAAFITAVFAFRPLPHIAAELPGAFHSGDFAKGTIGLVCLLILLSLPVFAWTSVSSGEFLHCDAKEMNYGKRSMFGKWKRQHFSVSQIRNLRRDVQGSYSKSRYNVLAFDYEGASHELFPGISYTASNQVLDTCIALGIDARNPLDPGRAMLEDIEKRGWFVNPFRADDDGESAAK